MRFSAAVLWYASRICAFALLAGCSGTDSSAPGVLAPVATAQPDASVARSNADAARTAQATSIALPGVPNLWAPDTSTGFADPDAARKGALIVADSSVSDVFVYTLGGMLTATITGFHQPQGLALDPAGDVYVANTLGNDIPVYKSDYKTLKAVLTDPGEYPVGVAYDMASGIVGVTNIISANNGPGSVSMYAKGALKPCVTLKNSAFAKMYGDGFDAAGNLYIDGLDGSGTRTIVGVVKNGCSASAIVPLTTGNAIAFPGDVKVSPAGDIAIEDQGAQAIYTYKPPTGTALGKPISTTPLKFTSDPVAFAFTKSAAAVYVTDVALPISKLQKFPYPAGGVNLQTIIAGKEPVAIAVTPLASP